MRRPVRVLSLFVFVAFPSLMGCGTGEPGGESPAPGADPESWEGDVTAAARLLRPHQGTEADWAILREKASLAWEMGWDSLPMGVSMARIGETLVGTAYVPHTLELPGEEQVVVNLQEMDCVTFVENVLALARLIRLAEPAVLESDLQLQELWVGLLREIRYQGGRVTGYPSRLHYFSDWIQDNEAKGLVREVTRELEGELDLEAIDFMTRNPQSYRQLANPAFLEAVWRREVFLNSQDRWRIPEEDIASRTPWIRDGDIIAVTSTVDGLDVAHTGLALWKEGALHLLHAPLVGEAVEVSREPLADRILRLEGQDGIRVVRPAEPPGRGG